MALPATISGGLNTFSVGLLGSREPEPIVLRANHDGSYSKEPGTKLETAYENRESAGVAGATVGWLGVIGVAESALRNSPALKSGIGRIGIRGAQLGAGALLAAGVAGVATGLLESDKVKLVYPDRPTASGEPTEQVISRADFEAGMEQPR